MPEDKYFSPQLPAELSVEDTQSMLFGTEDSWNEGAVVGSVEVHALYRARNCLATTSSS